MPKRYLFCCLLIIILFVVYCFVLLFCCLFGVFFALRGTSGVQAVRQATGDRLYGCLFIWLSGEQHKTKNRGEWPRRSACPAYAVVRIRAVAMLGNGRAVDRV